MEYKSPVSTLLWTLFSYYYNPCTHHLTCNLHNFYCPKALITTETKASKLFSYSRDSATALEYVLFGKNEGENRHPKNTRGAPRQHPRHKCACRTLARPGDHCILWTSIPPVRQESSSSSNVLLPTGAVRPFVPHRLYPN